MNKVYAEDVNFWKSGEKRSPDQWIEFAKGQIRALGGKVEAEGYGSDASGRAAFMLGFSLGGEMFKIIWPVLKARRSGEERAEKVQAATMLYHYVKSVCLYAVIVGPRAAFFAHLMLPDGRTASQLAAPELVEAMPAMLLPGRP